MRCQSKVLGVVVFVCMGCGVSGGSHELLEIEREIVGSQREEALPRSSVEWQKGFDLVECRVINAPVGFKQTAPSILERSLLGVAKQSHHLRVSKGVSPRGLDSTHYRLLALLHFTNSSAQSERAFVRDYLRQDAVRREAKVLTLQLVVVCHRTSETLAIMSAAEDLVDIGESDGFRAVSGRAFIHVQMLGSWHSVIRSLCIDALSQLHQWGESDED